jgi:two-component sensor histidine kinase
VQEQPNRPKTPGEETASKRMLVQSVQQQQAVLAEFGIEAFRTDDLDALLTKAAMLAGQGLGVKRAKVLELLPSGDQLLIRAGVGWEPDVVGHATIDADHASPAGYALLTGEAVTSEDLENDNRFRCPEVLRRHGIRGAVNVIIRGNDGPFGVLEVDSQQTRRFTDDDANFLQSYANLLAAAIDRLRTHRQLAEAARQQAELAQQKEVLLHELQHRVKNSLQIVTSFVSLQRRKAAPEAHDDLDVIASRIEALRVMYDKLYLVDHHHQIDFGSYLEELCGSLLQFQLAERKSVRLDLRCAPLQVNLDRSVPLGLLTSEFVLNSLKHAFVDGSGGTLTVRLETVDEQQARLLLADDGSGRPPPTGSMGSGLRLIEQLADQADATLTWDRAAGTRAELFFPV